MHPRTSGLRFDHAGLFAFGTIGAIVT